MADAGVFAGADAVLDASMGSVTGLEKLGWPVGVLASGSPGALLRRGPLRTVRASRPGTRLKQPAWAVRHRACAGRGRATAPGWRRAQSVWTRRWTVRPLLVSVMARWASALRMPRYQVSHWVKESGGSSTCSRGSAHSGQRPCWVRRARSQDGASCGGLRLRRRSAQYWARAGSSGECLPGTGACRTIFVQA